jgi:cell wall-associated protease
MAKKLFSSLVVFMLFFSFSFSEIPLVKASGEEKPVLEVMTLERSEIVETHFEKEATTHWDKVTPSG